jgi:hypothetical protein
MVGARRPMTRFDDWPERLEKFLAQSKDKASLEWGSFDCCLFSCDAVLAITGVDLAADFRGEYSSEMGAAKLLRNSKAWTVSRGR